MAEKRDRDLPSLDARMAQALAGVDPERTRRMFAGELGAGMTEVPTSVRLPEDVIRRLDALAKRMSKDPKAAALAGAGGVSRAAALRLAILEGIEALEARYSGKR